MRFFLSPRGIGLGAVLGGLALALAGSLTTAQEVADAALPRIEAATHKGYTEAIQGTDAKFEMVAIPGGTFLMGSPDSEPGRNPDEGPQHPVTLKPFWIGKCEVAWEEYDPYWKNNPGNKQEQMDAEKKNAAVKDRDALSRPTPPYADETFGFGREGQPVISLSHHAAMDYCRWLSQKTGKAYRLPTEAEWEWACRAGTKTAYSFGPDPKALKDYAWLQENSEEAPHKVGQKKPNAWCLHDMHGNVAEWCLDVFSKDAYAAFPLNKATLQPVALPSGERYGHVVRGGSWADKATALRSAARRASGKEWNRQDPQIPKSIWWLTDADFVGFRVVCAVEEQENLKGFRSPIKWVSK